MWKLVRSIALPVCGVLVVTASIVPWFLATAVCLMATGAELHRIADTGLPSSSEKLRWSAWSDGPGEFQPSTWVPGLHPNARIVAYRTGTASTLLVRLTFYQAEYVNPDGTVKFGHAYGPVPLIAPRRETCWGIFAACNLTATGVFVLAFAVRPKDSAPRVDGRETSGRRQMI